jgi:hypothetical protein
MLTGSSPTRPSCHREAAGNRGSTGGGGFGPGGWFAAGRTCERRHPVIATSRATERSADPGWGPSPAAGSRPRSTVTDKAPICNRIVTWGS